MRPGSSRSIFPIPIRSKTKPVTAWLPRSTGKPSSSEARRHWNAMAWWSNHPAIDGHTIVHVARKDGDRMLHLGLIAISDAVKTDSSAAIAELAAMGLKIVLITGDNTAAAAMIARQVRHQRCAIQRKTRRQSRDHPRITGQAMHGFNVTRASSPCATQNRNNSWKQSVFKYFGSPAWAGLRQTQSSRRPVSG